MRVGSILQLKWRLPWLHESFLLVLQGLHPLCRKGSPRLAHITFDSLQTGLPQKPILGSEEGRLYPSKVK